MTCGLGSACGSDSTDAPQSPIDLREAAMADAPAEAPAPKKKKSSLGKQVTSGVRRTVDAGRTVLSTMERGVKKTYDACSRRT